MIDHEYKILKDFFSCYFHPYWVEDYETAENVISYFVKETNELTLKATISELNQIINKPYNNDELRQLLIDLGCYYNVNYDYENILDWLVLIKERIES